MKSNKIAVLLLGLPGLTFAEVCADIEDDEARLACYDAESKGSAPAPAEPAQPETSPQGADESATPEIPEESATAVAAQSPDEFGIRDSGDGPKEYVEGTIVEILKSGQLEYIRLDNGQVWRELTDSRMRFREGRKVTISEGIMNSYDLKMEGYNKAVKVKRVR
jgi:hypothetical protein